MPEWKIGGRDVDGFITSYMCPECGYRIKPTYILKSCPNCHLEMTPDFKPHYRIKGIGDDGWYHYELINPEKLMKVVVDNEKTFTNVVAVMTNDKLKKIRILKANSGVIHERSFNSFTITSHGKEENK